jgi:chemotaxis protein CheY-P-specific phosphatase CheC
MSKDLFGNEIEILEEVEVKQKKVSPFDIAHDLTSKERYDSDVSEMKSYTKFLLNRTLSYHPDLIAYANEMNIHIDVSDRLHYDFLHYSIDKKRRSKKFWAKSKKYEHLELVKEYFNYSNQKALSALSVLSDKDIETITNLMNKGGVS